MLGRGPPFEATLIVLNTMLEVRGERGKGRGQEKIVCRLHCPARSHFPRCAQGSGECAGLTGHVRRGGEQVESKE